MLELVAKILPLIEVLLPLVVAVVLPWVAKRYIDEKRLERLLDIAEAAYWSTEGLVEKTPNKIDDKLHESLARVMEVLGRPLKDKEQRLVTARFAELAGRQKIATKLAGSTTSAALGVAAGRASSGVRIGILGPTDKQ